MYGGGDSAMGLFPLSAAFLSAGGIGTRGKPLETVGRKARGCGAGQPHYARSAAIRQTVGNGGAAKPEAKAHLCAMLVRLPNSLRPKMGKEGKIYYEKFKII